jgi:hypothetical protein
MCCCVECQYFGSERARCIEMIGMQEKLHPGGVSEDEFYKVAGECGCDDFKEKTDILN